MLTRNLQTAISVNPKTKGPCGAFRTVNDPASSLVFPERADRFAFPRFLAFRPALAGSSRAAGGRFRGGNHREALARVASCRSRRLGFFLAAIGNAALR